jgi:hypothetical protein
MGKKLAALVAGVTVMLAAVASAHAITNGVPDGTNHPYVG